MAGEKRRRGELVESLLAELRVMSAHAALFSQAVAERLGINATDLGAIGFLVEAGPLTAGRLAELTGLTTGAVTGVVDRLVAAGYAQREQDPHDRRRVIVQEVPGATASAGAWFAAMRQASADLCARYSKDDLALILDFLTRANSTSLEQTTSVRASSALPAEGKPAAAQRG